MSERSETLLLKYFNTLSPIRHVGISQEMMKQLKNHFQHVGEKRNISMLL